MTGLTTLLWPNGEITTGRSYAELEEAMRASQWSTYATRKEFRVEMLSRAELWSGSRPRAVSSSRELVEGLRDAGMYMMFTEPEV